MVTRSLVLGGSGAGSSPWVVLLVHGEPPALVHGILLQLEVAQLLLELAALLNQARGPVALTRVDLQQGPDAAANGAAALDLDGALAAMGEQVLHLLTVGRGAGGVAAAGRVGEQLHVQLDGALPLSPLLLGELMAAVLGQHRHALQVVLVRILAVRGSAGSTSRRGESRGTCCNRSACLR